MIFVWTVGDVLGLGLLALVLLWGVWITNATWWRESRCKHDGGVDETMACDAICRKCGKNLGFIGSWRERQQSCGGNGK